MFSNLEYLGGFPSIKYCHVAVPHLQTESKKNVQLSCSKLGFKGQFMLEWINE